MNEQTRLTPPMPVADGFMYNPRLLYAPNRYLPLALQNLMPYRTHKYQHRFYTAPPDPSVAIGAGQTIDTQLRIVPGSVIVGARFATLNGFPANQAMYLIRDSNTQKNFTDGKNRYINCQSLIPTGASGSPYCLFSKPYLVSADPKRPDGGGVIVVSITNLSTSTGMNCQLMLIVAEPAQIVTSADSGSIMIPQSSHGRRR